MGSKLNLCILQHARNSQHQRWRGSIRWAEPPDIQPADDVGEKPAKTREVSSERYNVIGVCVCIWHTELKIKKGKLSQEFIIEIINC